MKATTDLFWLLQDSMLMGCEAEVAELSRCKGRRHVDNLKAIHLSSIADVLKALNDDVKVDECQVFKQQLNQEPELNDDDDEPEVHQFPESGPESISPATSTIPSATLVFIFSVLRLFWWRRQQRRFSDVECIA